MAALDNARVGTWVGVFPGTYLHNPLGDLSDGHLHDDLLGNGDDLLNDPLHGDLLDNNLGAQEGHT